MEEDITEIKFPRTLNYQEARDLCRYLALKMRGGVDLRISTYRSERFGDSFLEKKSENLDELIERIIHEELSGYMARRNPWGSASFSLRSDHDDEKIFYTGLSFSVTPGTRLGELKSDSVEIMQDTRGLIKEYFDKLELTYYRDKIR